MILFPCTGRTMVINVEYNQLDPLLRATGHPDGDVNCNTGYSPYPGNINQVNCSLQTMLCQYDLIELNPDGFYATLFSIQSALVCDNQERAFNSAVRLQLWEPTGREFGSF